MRKSGAEDEFGTGGSHSIRDEGGGFGSRVRIRYNIYYHELTNREYEVPRPLIRAHTGCKSFSISVSTLHSPHYLNPNFRNLRKRASLFIVTLSKAASALEGPSSIQADVRSTQFSTYFSPSLLVSLIHPPTTFRPFSLKL